MPFKLGLLAAAEGVTAFWNKRNLFLVRLDFGTSSPMIFFLIIIIWFLFLTF